MAGEKVRFVNVIPVSKIKKEVQEDDDDVLVTCRLCNKGFVSEIALQNHAKIEHFDSFAIGDPTIWTIKPVNNKVQAAEDQKVITKKKTDELISLMEPTKLTTLASADVNYIILKSECQIQEKEEPKKRKRKQNIEKPSKDDTEKPLAKKEKEVQPITGPFECLQPSTLVADGTCHQIFFSCCEYSIHYRDEHTRRRKGIKCQVCEKPIIPGQQDTQSPFMCQVCGQGFNTNEELTKHSNAAHVKFKPYECNICLKRFTQLGGVHQHMRMHTGVRPFACRMCPKSFTQKSGLDQHMRIHTKVKPYRCVVCSKSFCQSIHLKQHMRTHTKVSPFQCGICQKKFKQTSHLNYHLRGHNSTTMTDEQKKKYTELIGLIEDASEMIEIEIDSDHISVQSQELLEQVEAEQSIQIETADGDCYTVTEIDDAPTWNVQLINAEEK